MVVLVVGPNHSGTSFVTKLLIERGADPGEYDPGTGQRIDYVKYENTQLKTYVVNLLKIQTDIPMEPHIDHQARFKAFAESLTGDKTYVLKYPRALFALTELRRIIGPDMRVVYVNRGLQAWLDSHMRRSGGSKEAVLAYLNQCATALMLYTGPVLKVNFEELLDGQGVDLLCSFAGLPAGDGGSSAG